MEDAFDLLAGDHEDVRQMLSELEKGPTAATGATEDQLMLRSMMTEELIVEVYKHEAAELRCFWPVVRAQVPDGDVLADRGVCQELEISELLAALRGLDAADARFEPLLGRFIAAGRAHIDFEERLAWPGLRAALTPKAAAELGRKILLDKRSGASRLLPGRL